MKCPYLGSKEEIVKYLNTGKSVQWMQLFENNHVPCDIFMEYKDRILKGEYIYRVRSFIHALSNGGIEMTDEVFGVVSKLNMDLYHNDMVDVYPKYFDFIMNDTKHRNEFCRVDRIIDVIRYGKNIPVNFMKFFLEYIMDAEQKITVIRSLVTQNNNKFPVLDEVRELGIAFLKEKYPSFMKNAYMLEDGSLESTLFTPEEFIQDVEPVEVYRFFVPRNTRFGEHVIDPTKTKFFTPEIVDTVVLKLLDWCEPIKQNPKIKPYVPIDSPLLAFIADHERYSEIEDVLISAEEKYGSKHISWEDVDVNFATLPDDVREVVLSRTDAPLWFTDKYQSKIMQLILIRTHESPQDKILRSFAEHYNEGFIGGYSSSPFNHTFHRR